MTHRFDCSELNTKRALLQKFADIFDEMYSLNYDAWVDVATASKEYTTWEFENIDSYENPALLREILRDISTQNPRITVLYI